MPKEQFRFVVIPAPYAYPISLSLGVPVSLEKARQIGEQARQWLELRTAVKGGIPVPDSPSVLKRGEACYLYIPNAVLSEERTKEGKTYLAETNRGDLYFTERNIIDYSPCQIAQDRSQWVVGMASRPCFPTT